MRARLGARSVVGRLSPIVARRERLDASSCRRLGRRPRHPGARRPGARHLVSRARWSHPPRTSPGPPPRRRDVRGRSASTPASPRSCWAWTWRLRAATTRARRRGRHGGHLHRGARRPARRHPRRLPAPAPAVPPAGGAQRAQPGRHVRAAQQRRLDHGRALRGRGLRASPARLRAAGPARAGRRARQVPPHDRLRRARPACASPTPTACGSAPTSPAARRSCTRATSTSTPARSGTAMVEGRISQGVVVGEGSDIGGGASIMGTLSGGGKEVIRVGERCLIGANAGIGISLGDDCVVEAGLYVTAGTRVTLPDGTVVKARRAQRPRRPAVPPQQHVGRRRGAAPGRRHGRAQHRPPPQRLTLPDLAVSRGTGRPAGGRPGRAGRRAAPRRCARGRHRPAVELTRATPAPRPRRPAVGEGPGVPVGRRHPQVEPAGRHGRTRRRSRPGTPRSSSSRRR